MAMLPQHFYISTSRALQKAACQLQLHIIPRPKPSGFSPSLCGTPPAPLLPDLRPVFLCILKQTTITAKLIQQGSFSIFASLTNNHCYCQQVQSETQYPRLSGSCFLQIPHYCRVSSGRSDTQQNRVHIIVSFTQILLWPSSISDLICTDVYCDLSFHTFLSSV